MATEADSSSAWKGVVPVWLASRAGLWTVAALASVLVPIFHDRPILNFTHPRASSPLFDLWARWDAEWYLAIAEGGYDYTIQDPFQASRYPYQPTAGFLPLYPLLIRLLTPLAGSGVAAGWWISNLSLLGFLFVWFGSLREEIGGAAARRALAYFLFLPASIFCSAVYAESLFLLLCAACLRAMRREQWAWAALFALGASLTRPAGVLLAAPLAIEAWRRRGSSPLGAAGVWLAALAPLAGIGAFTAFCWRTFGSPLVFFERQEAWRGISGPPWRAFVRYFQNGPAAHGVHNSTIELVFALAFLGLLAAGWSKLRRAEWVFCLLVVLVPLCGSLFSFSRLALPAYPLLALPALWGEKEWVDRALCAVLLPLQALFMILYQGWGWAA
jgi:hypothetical protein